ncbi:MAG: HesA/MoeB/ThiF family protein [Firmicutes bacterium]|nr:HesA/MoeB/ThiF family protein [Bacillota bacterium]MCM1400524.1 HesA/MoeB/ThiF family protein [Bacteroides sp.]MCM1476428.1 HesA/MoeB/ThiF family protein [Bacteroides sp.]
MSYKFSEAELARYARHIDMDGFGLEAQRKLAEGAVLIVGAGGLGSPVALYLAAAGVGRIGIADGDVVDVSNLQRQVIHNSAGVGRPKVESARESMVALNPGIKVETYNRYLAGEELEEVVSNYDFVVEATDSLETKFAVDRACAAVGKAYNYGGIFRFEGHTMTVLPGSVRLTDLFPDHPGRAPKLKNAGPLGVLPGVIGPIQAAEAIKYLTGIGELLVDRLLKVDLLTMRFATIRLK